LVASPANTKDCSLKEVELELELTPPMLLEEAEGRNSIHGTATSFPLLELSV